MFRNGTPSQTLDFCRHVLDHYQRFKSDVPIRENDQETVRTLQEQSELLEKRSNRADQKGAVVLLTSEIWRDAAIFQMKFDDYRREEETRRQVERERGIIVNRTNWCDEDYLDQKRLEDGELLEITMSDGTSERHRIRVVQYKVNEPEQGCQSGYDVPHSHAYIPTTYHGLRSEIRPIGLQARRIEGSD